MEEEDDKKLAAVESKGTTEEGDRSKEGGEEEEEEKDEEAAEHDEEKENQQPEEEDDVRLALSMMENAFAIYSSYQMAQQQSDTVSSPYLTWAQREQLPRVLSNIGDSLSFLELHADSADAYTRELEYREDNLKLYDDKNKGSLDELKDRRKAVEAGVLVATELLDCPPDQAVVTTETSALLVKASELVDWVTGYYQKARDQLQETVYLMAKLIEDPASNKAEVDKEKENICFAWTLLMGVGERLAEVKERQQEEATAEPLKKKAKRSV